jgi:hypothetical protein
MEAADRFLDDLAEAVKQYPDTLAQKAFDVLRAWDRTTNAIVAALCYLVAGWTDWTNLFSSRGVLIIRHYADGLKDPQKAVTLLVNAAKEVRSLMGAWTYPGVM